MKRPMGQVIHFEEQAVARLRERLGQAQEANEDLVAFARGHSDAVASINCAVLEAIEAPSVEALLDVITSRWPDTLGIDFVAIVLAVGDRTFRANWNGIERVEPAFVERILAGIPEVDVQSVESGHPLFGSPAARQIRAQALIRIDGPGPFPSGVIALGQRAELEAHSRHGSHLLVFLGKVVAAAIRRCIATA
jgi:uncharacterized protein YigA (DUF484 family)